MKDQTLVSISLLTLILGGTAGYAAEPPYCKQFHLKNGMNNPHLSIEYVLCGKVKSHDTLSPGAEKTYSVEPGSVLHVDAALGLLHYNIWPEKKIGDGWTVTCLGSYNHGWCESTPTLAPTDCKPFHVENKGHYYLQPEFIECTTGQLLKPHLILWEVKDYLVKPNTDVKVGMSTGFGDTSANIWASRPIKNGYNVTCEGYSPPSKASCKETAIP